MYHDVSYLLSRLINGPLSLRQIYFASSNGPVPDLAYQVDFPRLEIVLEGEFVDTGAGATLVPGDVLYVPAGAERFEHCRYVQCSIYAFLREPQRVMSAVRKVLSAPQQTHLILE